MGILADVLALRAEELGLHPGTVAAWGRPGRYSVANWMVNGVGVLFVLRLGLLSVSTGGFYHLPIIIFSFSSFFFSYCLL